jgi:hypothetical protein
MKLQILFELGPNLTRLGATLMAALTDFTTKLDAIDTGITELAAEIADLKARLLEGGMTPAEESEVLGRLATIETALNAAK